MKQFVSITLLAACLFRAAGVTAQANLLAPYHIQWTSQSENAGASMPCGGGDVGLNVWVEGGELFFYIARSGSFDENNALLKSGRVRIKLSPNPFGGDTFRQELVLQEGYVTISGSNGTHSAVVTVWVDVFRPAVHVTINTSKPVHAAAWYESWRYEDRLLYGKENNANSWKWAPQGDVRTYADTITFEGDNVLFYHRNREETVFDATVRQQGLDSVKAQLMNPLKYLTFGGVMQGRNMKPAGTESGRYLDTQFRGWKLESAQPGRAHTLDVYLYTEQADNVEAWKRGLRQTMGDAVAHKKTAWKKTRDWWQAFWQRSFIIIHPQQVRPQSPAWQAGRNYQLFRYMLGCNAYGEYPTKFNGGLFTYDPALTAPDLKFTPDYRNWGGGTMTAQNQRLVYFPMLKSGDFDMMFPQFNFYRRSLHNAELRSRIYWGHNGACFTEQLENFGLPNSAEYGWNRPAGFDPGVQHNAWLEYQWDTVLEFCLMILDTERYTNRAITDYMPLIESCLTFFDEHYQYLARRRGRQALDADGHLVLYPGSACETYKMAYNATSTIAALNTILSRLLELPSPYLDDQKRKRWQDMLTRIPPITFREFNGCKTIAPARLWERINNTETPQLYPVFPWGIYGVGKPDLDVAVNTYKYDTDAVKFRSHVGWKQDNIFAARLGLTDEAAALTLLKLQDSERRFPAFWGPGFDWTPDHNWGGSGMIGLQEMLLQVNGDKLYLFPAWPKEWDVHFKLHAPGQITVEGILKNGKLEMLNVQPRNRMNDIVNMLDKDQ